MIKIINDADIQSLCKQFDTPFYVYDGDQMKKNFNNIIEKLDTSISIYLSLKANNNISIARLFKRWGSGIEVASKGELFLAIKAGFPPEKIIFSGPGKKREEILFAIGANINCIIVESQLEMELLDSIAKELRKVVRIMIRINPDQSINTSSIKMGGAPRQFGIDEALISDVMKKLSTLTNLKFVGIHTYLGTQNLNEEEIADSFQYTIHLGEMIKERFEVDLEVINLGGGMGVNYYQNEQPINFWNIADRLNQMIVKAKYNGLANTKYIIESGRFLLAEFGIYVTRVLYTKYSKGQKFVIVDGGLHHHVASTFRGRMMKNNFPINTIKVKKTSPVQGENVYIVGPLCTPEDCLARDIYVELLEPGDIVYILKSGAYGLSYSPNQFLGHPTPMEILKMDNEFHIVRDRGDIDDLLVNQRLIDI